MTRRWPPIVIIAALLVGGLVVGRDDGGSEGSSTPADPATLLPVAAPDDALDGTWFCAAQSSGADTPADGTIVIANVGDTPATGVLQVVAAGSDDAPVTQALSVPPLTTQRYPLADLLQADWVAAQVQVRGGTVVVDHEVVGENGRSAAPCQSRGADHWFLPTGASTRDARYTLAIYNPYPGDARVDLAFTTEDGVREPGDLQGLAVGSGALVVVDVSELVTERAVVGTSLTARRGQVVIEQLQTYDGTGSATTDEEAEAEGYVVREGMALTPGVADPRTVWSFPSGAKAPFLHEQVVLFNPGGSDAEVDLTFDLAEPERNGVLDPFEVTVPAGEVVVFDVDAIESIPADVTHSVTVRSRDGIGVLAAKTLAASGDDAPYTGVATVTGSPVAAPRWAFPSGSEPGVERGRVVVTNPGDEAVDVDLTFLGDGQASPVPGGGSFSIEPGGRREVQFEDLPEGRTTLLVDATGPVVAERRSFVDSLLVRAAADAEDGEDAEDIEVPPGLTTTLGLPLPPGLVLLD